MSKQQIVKKKHSLNPKPWTKHQDEILKQVIDKNQPEKWTLIAQILQKKHSIKGRTPKDCKERWLNDIEPSLRADLWTDEEERKMLEYHRKFGNKWAKIAQMLNQKSDNCVKNYFYCTLRKGFKKVNKFLTFPKNRGKYRQIKMTVLLKCVAVAEDRFQRKLGVSQQLIQKCQEIKSKLFQIAKDSFKQQTNQKKMAEILNDLLLFNKSYKKKKKSKINPKGKPQKTNKKSNQKEDSEQQNQESKEQEQKQKQQNNEEQQNPYKIVDISKPQSVCRDLFKSRIASGQSMDFLGKLSRLGSIDVVSRLGSVEWAVGQHFPPSQTLSPNQSARRGSFQKSNSMSRCKEEVFQKNMKDYLIIPNLGVPSFQSYTTYNNLLGTTSSELLNEQRGKGHRQLQQLLTLSREGFSQQYPNPLMHELQKISSIDFQNFRQSQRK